MMPRARRAPTCPTLASRRRMPRVPTRHPARTSSPPSLPPPTSSSPMRRQPGRLHQSSRTPWRRQRRWPPCRQPPRSSTRRSHPMATQPTSSRLSWMRNRLDSRPMSAARSSSSERSSSARSSLRSWSCSSSSGRSTRARRSRLRRPLRSRARPRRRACNPPNKPAPSAHLTSRASASKTPKRRPTSSACCSR